MEEDENDDEDSHLSKLAPRVVDRESVMMAVSAMPSANKIRCHTTTSTLDNTCNESFVPLMFFFATITWFLAMFCFRKIFLTFCTMTLLASRRVMVTPITRKMLCQPF